MRQSIQQTADDLSNLVERLSRRIDDEACDFKRTRTEAILESLEEILPEADVIVSSSADRDTLTVRDENVAARELGSLSLEPDRPITRVLESVSNR